MSPILEPLYPAPFDDADADVVICSSDQVYFRVFKVILKKASPVFGGMFTLPPTGNCSAPGEEVPVVEVSEDGETMTQLLRLCYPTYDSRLETIEQVTKLMDVCEKYQMDDIAKRLAMTTLGNFMAKDPILVYVLARRAGATEEAQAAAFHCLSLSPSEIIVYDNPALCRLSATAYRNLLDYHFRCRQAAASVVSHWGADKATEYCWGHWDPVLFEGGGFVCSWWQTKMAQIADELLHKMPPMTRLTSTSPLLEVGRVPCKNCQSRAQADMHRFATVLEAQIRKAVTAVEFKVQCHGSFDPDGC
ncbi:hypothetical protein BDW22DRAFT_1431375 [Trametopsis cervina]|nr:hypothetical protein BDW22DRAFT_1431375 [Trametopsis cervina]